MLVFVMCVWIRLMLVVRCRWLFSCLVVLSFSLVCVCWLCCMKLKLVGELFGCVYW